MNLDISTDIKSNWIKILNDTFICGECENEIGGKENHNQIETSSSEGIVKANLKVILSEISESPNKITYAICPVCGMEYVFKQVANQLYLEPSEMEK